MISKLNVIGSCFALLALGGAIAAPAQAQNLSNQSDISGTNVFNTVSPDFFDQYREVLSPEDLTTAQELSSRLNDAYAACLDSSNRATGPRRFALGPAPNVPCTTAECEALDSLLEQTRAFLARIGASTDGVTRVLEDRPW
jgi:hypothetical protein